VSPRGGHVDTSLPIVISENDGNQLGYFGGGEGVERSGLERLELDSHAVADLYTLIHSGHLRICRQVKSTLGLHRTSRFL